MLAKKYLKRWKVIAWSLGLKRRGKERRKTFARSLRDKALDRSTASSGLETSPFAMSMKPESQFAMSKAASSMPPPLSTSRQKRQSLPVPSSHHVAQIPESFDAPSSNKRKREDHDPAMDHGTPKIVRLKHKRSSTVGTSIMSAPPHRSSRTPFRTSIDPSRIGDGSLLGDTLMRQTRRLAANAKSDTTRTDYFKLKAMGVDPDTTIIPATRKRSRTSSDSNNNSKVDSKITSSLTNGVQSSAAPMKTLKPSGHEDDEDLFASIRTVRDTLADSTSWFQHERQSIERSMTPQAASATPPNRETAAERRLREIRERGPTPSRSEIRLRALGDSALLPKGFWDTAGIGSSRHGNGRERERGMPETPTRPPGRARGFAALSQQQRTPINGIMNGDTRGRGSSQGSSAATAQNGASVEDAIEL